MQENWGPERARNTPMAKRAQGRKDPPANSFCALLWGWLWESPSNWEDTGWVLESGVCVLILLETLCHSEEKYYCNACSHSLCILATYWAFLCQVFNASRFRTLANIGSIVLKMLHLLSDFNKEKNKTKPKQNKQKETPQVPRCLYFYFGCYHIYLYL